MMLAFLADMLVPQSVVELARDLGHDARHVREYAMQRATDLVILQRAVQEQRILLTMDLGFSREMILTDLWYAGLVVFRLGNVAANEITEAFRRLLSQLSEDEILNHITVSEPGRVRRRRLPTGK